MAEDWYFDEYSRVQGYLLDNHRRQGPSQHQRIPFGKSLRSVPAERRSSPLELDREKQRGQGARAKVQNRRYARLQQEHRAQLPLRRGALLEQSTGAVRRQVRGVGRQLERLRRPSGRVPRGPGLGGAAVERAQAVRVRREELAQQQVRAGGQLPGREGLPRAEVRLRGRAEAAAEAVVRRRGRQLDRPGEPGDERRLGLSAPLRLGPLERQLFVRRVRQHQGRGLGQVGRAALRAIRHNNAATEPEAEAARELELDGDAQRRARRDRPAAGQLRRSRALPGLSTALAHVRGQEGPHLGQVGLCHEMRPRRDSREPDRARVRPLLRAHRLRAVRQRGGSRRHEPPQGLHGALRGPQSLPVPRQAQTIVTKARALKQ
ncbi:unnamed protein product [Trichogramma brassicae]|uniref:Uncharacterized protein n=1 Tax=Trichogramma brassicae TaxID=86971 RepID=A0A6H5IVX5_9HYME|nr:unnamed protein product [Trichogramma brassicae]